jgi:hypothetical protein
MPEILEKPVEEAKGVNFDDVADSMAEAKQATAVKAEKAEHSGVEWVDTDKSDSEKKTEPENKSEKSEISPEGRKAAFDTSAEYAIDMFEAFQSGVAEMFLGLDGELLKYKASSKSDLQKVLSKTFDFYKIDLKLSPILQLIVFVVIFTGLNWKRAISAKKAADVEEKAKKEALKSDDNPKPSEFKRPVVVKSGAAADDVKEEAEKAVKPKKNTDSDD